MSFELPFSADRADKSAKKFTTTIGKAGKAVKGTTAETKKLTKSLKKTSKAATFVTAALGTLAVTASTKLLLSSLKTFREFEKGLIGVGKTADLSGKKLAQMGDRISALSLRLPIATTELLEISMLAAQLGVKGSENILNFTETIAKLAASTNLTSEAAATMLAQILGVTGEGIKGVNNLASVIVQLGNNSKTTESLLTQMTLEIVKATAQFSLGSTNAAALATAMKSLGIQAELGRSALSMTFQALNKITSEGGDKLKSLNKLVGATGDQFVKTFRTDANKAFNQFILGLSKLNKFEITSKLEEFRLKGIGVLSVIPTLAVNVEKLAKKYKLANDELKKGTALENEFARTLTSLDSKIKITGNKFDDLKKRIGAALAPLTTKILDNVNKEIEDKGPGIVKKIKAVANAILKFEKTAEKNRKKNDRWLASTLLRATQSISIFGYSLTGAAPGAQTEQGKKAEEDKIALKKRMLIQTAKQLKFQSQIEAEHTKIANDLKDELKAMMDQKRIAAEILDKKKKQQEINKKAAIVFKASLDKDMKAEIKRLEEVAAERVRLQKEATKQIMDDFQNSSAMAVGTFVADLIRGSKEASKNLALSIGNIMGKVGGQLIGQKVGNKLGDSVGAQIGSEVGGVVGGAVGSAAVGFIINSFEKAQNSTNALADSFDELKKSQIAYNKSFTESTRTLAGSLAEFQGVATRFSDLHKRREKNRIRMRELNAQISADGDSQVNSDPRVQEYSRLSAEINNINHTIPGVIREFEALREIIGDNIEANLSQVESIKNQRDEFIKSTLDTRDSAQKLRQSTAKIAHLTPEVEALKDYFTRSNLTNAQLLKVTTNLNDRSTELAEAYQEQLDSMIDLIDAQKTLKNEFKDYQEAFQANLKGKTISELTSEFNMALSGLKGTNTSEGLQSAFDEAKFTLEEIARLTGEGVGVQREIIKTLEDSQKSIFDKIFELTSGGLSPDQTFARKQDIFDNLVIKAQGGEAFDIERLLNFTDSFLESARNQFKSSEDYQRIFDDIIDNILPGISEDAQTGIDQANIEIVSLEGSLLGLRQNLDEMLTPAITNLTDAILSNTEAVLKGPSTTYGPYA